MAGDRRAKASTDDERSSRRSGGKPRRDPGPTPQVAAAAIRDAIEALGDSRPDLAARLARLLDDLEEELGP